MSDSSAHIENAWLAGIAAGDKKAFASIYRTRWLPVFYFVKKMVLDQQAAEDIATDTFIKCWRRRTDFEQIASLDAFLFTTARNASLNHLRDTRRRSAKQKQLDSDDQADPVVDWEEQQVAVLVYKYIYDEIARLPENMQNVLRLHLAGEKNDAIAARLNLSEKSVRNLKSEAIRILRLRLSDKEFAFLRILLLCIPAGIS